MTHQKGYTLIELLIVILIISIMTSILIPTFTQRTTLSDVKLGAETVRSALLNAQVSALSLSRSKLLELANTPPLSCRSITVDSVNYVFVDFPEMTLPSVQMAISDDTSGSFNKCYIEKPVYLSSKLKLNTQPLIFYEVGTGKASSIESSPVAIELQAANNPTIKAKVVINLSSGLITIE